MGAARVIVVGVDGSGQSAAALRYALEDAARGAARVWVVWAFDPPERWTATYGITVPLTVTDVTERLTARARGMVDEALAQDVGLTSVPVELKVLPGDATSVLVIASREADLLVVGHRGRGGVASTVLGSVGLGCVLHAHCSVTVVRPGRE